MFRRYRVQPRSALLLIAILLVTFLVLHLVVTHVAAMPAKAQPLAKAAHLSKKQKRVLAASSASQNPVTSWLKNTYQKCDVLQSAKALVTVDPGVEEDTIRSVPTAQLRQIVTNVTRKIQNISISDFTQECVEALMAWSGCQAFDGKGTHSYLQRIGVSTLSFNHQFFLSGSEMKKKRNADLLDDVEHKKNVTDLANATANKHRTEQNPDATVEEKGKAIADHSRLQQAVTAARLDSNKSGSVECYRQKNQSLLQNLVTSYFLRNPEEPFSANEILCTKLELRNIKQEIDRVSARHRKNKKQNNNSNNNNNNSNNAQKARKSKELQDLIDKRERLKKTVQSFKLYNPCDVIVFVGDWTRKPYMRFGFRNTVHKQLVEMMKQMKVQVHLIDEHRSSKLCSFCEHVQQKAHLIVARSVKFMKRFWRRNDRAMKKEGLAEGPILDELFGSCQHEQQQEEEAQQQEEKKEIQTAAALVEDNAKPSKQLQGNEDENEDENEKQQHKKMTHQHKQAERRNKYALDLEDADPSKQLLDNEEDEDDWEDDNEDENEDENQKQRKKMTPHQRKQAERRNYFAHPVTFTKALSALRSFYKNRIHKVLICVHCSFNAQQQYEEQKKAQHEEKKKAVFHNRDVNAVNNMMKFAIAILKKQMKTSEWILTDSIKMETYESEMSPTNLNFIPRRPTTLDLQKFYAKFPLPQSQNSKNNNIKNSKNVGTNNNKNNNSNQNQNQSSSATSASGGVASSNPNSSSSSSSSKNLEIPGKLQFFLEAWKGFRQGWKKAGEFRKTWNELAEKKECADVTPLAKTPFYSRSYPANKLKGANFNNAIVDHLEAWKLEKIKERLAAWKKEVQKREREKQQKQNQNENKKQNQNQNQNQNAGKR